MARIRPVNFPLCRSLRRTKNFIKCWRMWIRTLGHHTLITVQWPVHRMCKSKIFNSFNYSCTAKRCTRWKTRRNFTNRTWQHVPRVRIRVHMERWQIDSWLVCFSLQNCLAKRCHSAFFNCSDYCTAKTCVNRCTEVSNWIMKLLAMELLFNEFKRTAVIKAVN